MPAMSHHIKNIIKVIKIIKKRNHFSSVYKMFGVLAKGFPRKTVLEIIPHFVYVKTKYSKPETVERMSL